MNKRYLTCLLALLLWSRFGFAYTVIRDFRVQHEKEPIAVEDRHPLFGWKMDSDLRGQKQTAYQLVLIREVDGGELWNTGKVLSDCSVDIPYRGVALQPEKGYRVQLTVWDKNDIPYHCDTRFETGLMSTRPRAWKGAQWIGSREITLDAASQCLFVIETRFRILKGRKASLILGADDFRLQNAFQNCFAVASKESYIQVEVEPDIPEVRIYRVGYFPGDTKDRPMATLKPGHAISTEGAEHFLSLQVDNSEMTLSLDGELLTVSGPVVLNELGSGGNHISFPNLAQVGFSAEPGSEVVYSDYRILNAGESEDRLAFDNRYYGIFEQIPGVHAEGNRICVSNPGPAKLQGWADPSHGAETQLRTEFRTRGKVKEARLYASGMGIYDLFLNGEHVGDAWFAPGNSQYREVLGYQKYDVTEMLQEGENALSASLAGGWYSGYMTFVASNFNFFGDYPALLSRLSILYEDGSREDIVTSPETWKAFNDGPLRLGSFFQGERYDARKETPGWNRPGFDDRDWASAQVIAPREWIDFSLTARYDEPVKVREVLTARRIMPASDAHTHIYDMGVNMVGVPEISIPAGWLKEGETVILTYGEQLYPGLKGDSKEYIRRFGRKGRNVAGHILFESNRAALDSDFYTAAGSEAVTIRPSKTFRGYQYIQVYIPSHEGALPPGNVKGLVLSSCQVPTGTYRATTSDGNRTGTLVNQLFRNLQRSQLGNYLTIPTDCPQRNERMGWTGDAQVYTRTGTYHADVQNFFRQWMVSLRADQGIGDDVDVPGGIGSTVPTFVKADDTIFSWGTTWSAAVCQVPWQLFIQYGDTRVVEENFDTMMDWLNGMAFYANKDYPYLSTKTDGLADHLALDDRTPRELLNNAIYIRMMEVVSIMADAIGRHAEARTLRERHDHAVEDWNRCFVDPETGMTRDFTGEIVHTQSSYATPLNFHAFNEENRARAAAHLASLVRDPGHGFGPYTVTTGFSGTPNLLPALSENGYAQEAYRMICNTAYPSWLYPVTQGATSVWERWNSRDTAFAAQTENGMNSFNHFALGSVGEWMYEYQLGITNDHEKGEAGYRHFVLQPSAGADYTALEGSFDSAYGTIRSAWTASEGILKTYRCTIPANTSATLYLPVDGNTTETAPCEGAVFCGFTVRNGLRVASFELVSGTWEFTFSGKTVCCTFVPGRP